MTLIIAELGSNPSPDWSLREYVETAALCGADAVKVQLWKPDHFPEAERDEKAAHQFPRERLAEFVELAHANKMQAGASVFDKEDVEIGKGLDFQKIALRESLNVQLAVDIFFSHAPIVYGSIPPAAVGAAMFGGCIPLGCIGKYPTSLAHAAWGLFEIVSSIDSHIWRKSHQWGWSSHTTSGLDCIWAARLGASTIEKHLALHETDCEAGHSLLPADFARMTGKIKWSL